MSLRRKPLVPQVVPVSVATAALLELRGLEWVYPPLDAIKTVGEGGWRSASRCPKCFGSYPNHKPDCTLGHLVKEG